MSENIEEKTKILEGGITYEETAKPQITTNEEEQLNKINNLVEKVEYLNGVLEDLNNKNIVNYDTDYIFETLIDYDNAHIQSLENSSNIKKSEIKAEQQALEKLKQEKKRIKEQQIAFKKIINANKSTSNLSNINTLGSKHISPNNYIKFTTSDPTEPIIKRVQKSLVNKHIEEEKKAQERADIFYGTDEEYIKKYYKDKNIKKFNNDLENYTPYKEEKPLDIANIEKTLFPNGTLADIPLAKLQKENLKITFEKERQKTIEKLKNQKIDFTNNEQIKLSELFPNVETMLNGIRTKGDIVADRLYTTMDKERVKLITDYYLIKRVANEMQKIINENKKNDISVIETLLKVFNIDYFSKHSSPEEFKKMLEEYLNGGYMSLSIASILMGKDAASLFRLALKNPDKNVAYLKNTKWFNNKNELPLKYQNIITDKLKQQKLNPNAEGILFYPNSELTNSIINCNIFKEKLYKIYNGKNDNNLEVIKQGNDTYYNSSLSFRRDKNLYYAINNTDIKNLKFDKFGNVTGDIIDTLDYNEGEDNPLVKMARKLQLEGVIEPKFIIVNFSIPYDEFLIMMDEVNRNG